MPSALPSIRELFGSSQCVHTPIQSVQPQRLLFPISRCGFSDYVPRQIATNPDPHTPEAVLTNDRQALNIGEFFLFDLQVTIKSEVAITSTSHASGLNNAADHLLALRLTSVRYVGGWAGHFPAVIFTAVYHMSMRLCGGLAGHMSIFIFTAIYHISMRLCEVAIWMLWLAMYRERVLNRNS